MEIRIRCNKLLWLLIVIMTALTLANLISLALRFHWGYIYAAGFAPLFDVNGEDNFPSAYSTITLFVCASLLALTGSAKKNRNEKFANHWIVLCVIFIYLAIDESISIHEHISYQISEILADENPLYFAWILPYSLLLMLFALHYWKFLAHLRPLIKKLFIIAGSTYLLGAMGFETLSGLYAMQFGLESFWYAALGSVEELLEMIGIIIFIYALCLQLSMDNNKLTITVTATE